MKPLFSLLALGLSASAAMAQADEPLFSVSGYGTLAWTRLSGQDAQYRVGTAEPNGADHSGSGETDSKLGLQITARPTDALSATVHLLSKKNVNNNFNPRVEWAYGKYDFTPNLSVRAGRLALPGFVLSDYLNVGYSMTPVRGPVDSLVSMLRMMGETGAANRLVYQDKHSSFTGLGVGYDNGKLLVQSEYTIRKAGGFLADTTGWYVLGGWRFGNFTPYAMAARQRVTSDTQYSGVANPMLGAYVNGLLASGNTSQKSWSLGLRWDLAKNMALKAQYDRVRPDHGSSAGLLMSGSTSTLSARSVATLAMDVVF